jgi:short subunit dehydrogenase-like uncharacterized protein
MIQTLLLYGATGYSGRLIAEEAAMRIRNGTLPLHVILAGRDDRAVSALAAEHDLEARAFGLAERRDVARGLEGVDVVLNAAGPFALTAPHLARGALAGRCHYVDICGEPDVYMSIDDLAHHARQRKVALVAGAGHTAAASDVLLAAALTRLEESSTTVELGAVRIAMSRIMTLSRGSLETLVRSTREQVRVVRTGEVTTPDGKTQLAPVLWHEPLGKLERTFDFFRPTGADRASELHENPPRVLRIATAASLLDTLTARITLDRYGVRFRRIESYVEANTAARLAYQVGAALAPVAAMPAARSVLRLQLDALPDGPTPRERAAETHLVVLEIDDAIQTPLVEWAWHTPNPYDFTARVALEVAVRVAASQPVGWKTPSEILNSPPKEVTQALTSNTGHFRDCRLHERRSPKPERHT